MDQKKEDWKESWIGWPSKDKSKDTPKPEVKDTPKSEVKDTPKSEVKSLQGKNSGWFIAAPEVKSLQGKNSGWFIAAAFFAMIALYKNQVYDSDAGINAYVGGDAYNFIINANKFVGWMVLSLILTIVGCTKTIVDAIKELKS